MVVSSENPSHWSLLAVLDGTALHYDGQPSGSSRAAAARELARVRAGNLQLQHAECAKQLDSHSCGAWVLAHASEVACPCSSDRSW